MKTAEETLMTLIMPTEYLATTVEGSIYCPLFGYRVLRQGRYGKWNKAGLYCDQQAAQHFIDKCTNGPAEKYRIVRENLHETWIDLSE